MSHCCSTCSSSRLHPIALDKHAERAAPRRFRKHRLRESELQHLIATTTPYPGKYGRLLARGTIRGRDIVVVYTHLESLYYVVTLYPPSPTWEYRYTRHAQEDELAARTRVHPRAREREPEPDTPYVGAYGGAFLARA